MLGIMQKCSLAQGVVLMQATSNVELSFYGAEHAASLHQCDQLSYVCL